MTDPTLDTTPTGTALIDGRTLEQLSDYLDAGMTPPDPVIDSSPACQLALDALRAVETATVAALDREAATLPPPDPAWLQRMIDVISLNVAPGRTVPLDYPDPRVTLTTTESAVRGLVRAVGDATPGVIVGRCLLDGDITVPGAPLRVQVDAAVYWGRNIPDAVDRLRRAMAAALREHTDLNVTDIDVTVHDVYGHASVAEETP